MEWNRNRSRKRKEECLPGTRSQATPKESTQSFLEPNKMVKEINGNRNSKVFYGGEFAKLLESESVVNAHRRRPRAAGMESMNGEGESFQFY